MNHKRKKIVLTGGGTAGHVIPHIALLPFLRQEKWDLVYLGSNGIERELIGKSGIKFKTIAAGKLRRYFSLKNFSDFFKVALGCIQSLFLLIWIKPNLVFSKGGFVSVPVTFAAWLLKIPVITHESDQTPGLANRIILRFAKKILYSFPETARHLPSDKAIYTGTPIRRELFTGDPGRGYKVCGFSEKSEKPIILVMGGSLGALKINQALKECIDTLIEDYRIVHITGKGKGIDFQHPDYQAFTFLGEELKDIFAITDFVIARAGANSIFEFLALHKPMLLIPLEAGSRGDQILNANSFAKEGWAKVLREKALSGENLLSEMTDLTKAAEQMKNKQRKLQLGNSSDTIIQILRSEV
ncbi:MAG: undecaprenyldiphospho-muramoylpentapeptide beta-N-acetylglucosaminyltransferase [Oligoflexales bacterium]|nr:undecaprenyldiphospho-muramoylpentapeptide beta-N-acetylglucosaminyltransferase [Oligoflexales bacterium]